MAKKAMRTERISIRVTPDLKMKFQKSVQQSGVSQAAFFLQCYENNNNLESQVKRIPPKDFMLIDSVINRIQLSGQINHVPEIVDDAKFLRNQVQKIKEAYVIGWCNHGCD